MKIERGDQVLLEKEHIRWYASTGKLVVDGKEYYPDNFWIKLLRFLRKRI